MTKKVTGLRGSMGVGARGPLSRSQLVNPAHLKSAATPKQGVSPTLYRDK